MSSPMQRPVPGFSVAALICCVIVLLNAFAAAETLQSLTTPLNNNTLNKPFAVSPDRLDVDIDFSLITHEKSPVSSMTVHLPDRVVTLVKDRIEIRGTDNYTWFGKVEGRELSSVVLTVVQGIMYGHMNIDGVQYAIEPELGNYLIITKDSAGFVPVGDDMVFPSLSNPTGIRPLAVAPLAVEDGSSIKLLVLYTQAIQTKLGSGLNARIQHLVDIANQAYTRSNINTQLSLAGTELYNNANVIEGTSMYNALYYITCGSTSYSDCFSVATPTPPAQIAAWRDSYHADLVSLMRVYHYAEGGGCGLGWTMDTDSMTFAPFGYSVIKDGSDYVPPLTYSCSDTTLAHELGHNMGCAHDRAHSSSAGAYPYSYGYDQIAAAAAGYTTPLFGTIMSYVIDNPINYFSNPSIFVPGSSSVYIGITGGVSGNDNPATSADNSRTINLTRVNVSNFRVNPSLNVTVTTSPAGRTFSVDSTLYTSLQAFTWNSGSSHTLGVSPTMQSGGAGTQYVYASWSDGGAVSHTVSPSSDVSYIANFTTQYQMTTSVINGSGSISPDCSSGCWYNSGQNAFLTAISAVGYSIFAWGGDCTLSGSNLAAFVNMTAPANCTADFRTCVNNAVQVVRTGDKANDLQIVYPLATMDYDIIQMQAVVLTGPFDLSGDHLNISLAGGYNCNFDNGSNRAYTVLNGLTTVGGSGSVIMDGIVIL